MLKIRMRVIIVQRMSQGAIDQSCLRTRGSETARNYCSLGLAAQVLDVFSDDCAG